MQALFLVGLFGFFSATSHCNVQLSQVSDFSALSSSATQNHQVVTGPPAQWGEVEHWYRVVMRSLKEIETSNREGPEYIGLDWPTFQQDSGPEISGGSVQPKMKLLSYPYSFQFLCSYAAQGRTLTKTLTGTTGQFSIQIYLIATLLRCHCSTLNWKLLFYNSTFQLQP